MSKAKNLFFTSLFFLLLINSIFCGWLILNYSSINKKYNIIDDGKSAIIDNSVGNSSDNDKDFLPPPLTWINEDGFPRSGICYKWQGFNGKMGTDKAKALLLTSAFKSNVWIDNNQKNTKWIVLAPSSEASLLAKNGFNQPYKINDHFILALKPENDARSLAEKLTQNNVSGVIVKPYGENETKFIIMPKSAMDYIYLRDIVSKIPNSKLNYSTCPGDV